MPSPVASGKCAWPMSIASIPGQLANVTMTPNDLLNHLLNTTSGIEATGGGNVLANFK